MKREMQCNAFSRNVLACDPPTKTITARLLYIHILHLNNLGCRSFHLDISHFNKRQIRVHRHILCRVTTYKERKTKSRTWVVVIVNRSRQVIVLFRKNLCCSNKSEPKGKSKRRWIVPFHHKLNSVLQSVIPSIRISSYPAVYGLPMINGGPNSLYDRHNHLAITTTAGPHTLLVYKAHPLFPFMHSLLVLLLSTFCISTLQPLS